MFIKARQSTEGQAASVASHVQTAANAVSGPNPEQSTEAKTIPSLALQKNGRPTNAENAWMPWAFDHGPIDENREAWRQYILNTDMSGKNIDHLMRFVFEYAGFLKVSATQLKEFSMRIDESGPLSRIPGLREVDRVVEEMDHVFLIFKMLDRLMPEIFALIAQQYSEATEPENV